MYSFAICIHFKGNKVYWINEKHAWYENNLQTHASIFINVSILSVVVLLPNPIHNLFGKSEWLTSIVLLSFISSVPSQIVEYLIEVCGADVEQRGRYEVPDDRTIHTVTPLWCASVAGMFKVNLGCNYLWLLLPFHYVFTYVDM